MEKRKDYTELIDPELRIIAKCVPYNILTIKLANIFQTLCTIFVRIPRGIRCSKISIKGFKNKNVPTEIIEPYDNDKSLPVIIYFHGGAFSYKASVHHKKLAFKLVKGVGCRVVFPSYHLMPKFSFPAAHEDALAVYRWVQENADELKIDTNSIVLAGDSAGAAIAAVLSNMYEKENLIKPCAQMLVYPVTDASMSTESMEKYKDTPVWNSVSNHKMWKYYLRNSGSKDAAIASPMNNILPKSIPDTYIETAEYDALHDEGVLYADRLRQAGANVILNETKGTIHGYDNVYNAKVTKAGINERIKFIKSKVCKDKGLSTL